MPTTAFFAYPADPPLIGETIQQATSKIDRGQLIITPWQKERIVGLKLDDLIRDRILAVDFLVADITYPNFNVYYEIGYAIGLQKPLITSLNYAVDKAVEHANLTGIFDTVGQARYQNSDELVPLLSADIPEAWTNQYFKDKNHTQPLFVLDTFRKTDFRNYIFQSIANSAVQYRKFDPEEVARLALPLTIGDVSSSAGVIIPLISSEITDAHRHNLRAAFVAGLCHGFGIEPLIIQFEDAPAPLDYRDFIETTRTRHEIEQAVSEYCQTTLVRNQQRATVIGRVRRTILNDIDIGSSAAENEYEKLGRYFIRTAEYQRAVRSSAGIVVGRKGSGKSAIFLQLAEERERDKRNLVLELNPASHNLSELRKELLGVANISFEHTIAAFWQYILYAEIVLRVRETILPKAKYSLNLLQEVQSLEDRLKFTSDLVAGDFTSRLALAIQSILANLKDAKPGSELKQRLTNILFENEIPKFREAIVRLGTDFSKIVLLFDNLDKGWPARQIEQHDVRAVHHLIEALGKIERDLRRAGIVFEYFLFLRSDVYETLVEQTSDRGKYNVIRVDWSDPKQLEHLIQERIVTSVDRSKAAEAWQAVNPTLSDGGLASDHIIRSSLMRPRFLIELFEKAISFAINRGHGSINADDVEAALRQQSLYLVSDFAYEIRDVAGISEGIFFKFIGKGELLTPAEVAEIVGQTERMGSQEIIDLLVWYGFLGISGPDARPLFIYERDYDMRRIDADREIQRDGLLYVVNPAFLRGLTN